MTFLHNKSVAFLQNTVLPHIPFLWNLHSDLHPISLKRLALPFNLCRSQQRSGFTEPCFLPGLTCEVCLFYRKLLNGSITWSLFHIYRLWGVKVPVFFHWGHCPFTSLFESCWRKRAGHISKVCKPSFQDSPVKGFLAGDQPPGIWSLDFLPKALDHGAQTLQSRGTAHGLCDAPICMSDRRASTMPR